MTQSNKNSNNIPHTARPVKVWDVPTRLFHWLLVVLVTTSFVTAKIGGNLMTTHMISGYLVLTLLVFRIMWGVFGGLHARFVSFVCSPVAVLRYAATITRIGAPRYLGHNPLGGWSVITMLTVLLIQASTGLFASDDIFTEGPLYPLVSNAISSTLTRIHNINATVIGCLVAVHVAAVLFYLLVKGENLIKPLFTGFKVWQGEAPPCGGNLWIAALAAAISSLIVYLLVSLMPMLTPV
ncbi:MAG: cytochrome b/b6 domain-containing protein [Desulfobacterales bacterium]|jgi:cytochrome b